VTNSDKYTEPKERYVGWFGVVCAGALLALIGVVLFSALVNLWPVVDLKPSHAAQGRVQQEAAAAGGKSGQKAEEPDRKKGAGGQKSEGGGEGKKGGEGKGNKRRKKGAETRSREVTFLFGEFSIDLSRSTGLIVLALLMGAIGGFIHASTSFASYTGNRQLKWSWMWWYGLRLFIGAALGGLTYFALRGGFLGQQGDTARVDPYGVAALAALAGLFSKQAIDKLEEVFDVLFRSQRGDEERADKLKDRNPVIRGLRPNRVAVARTDTIEVSGENFVRGAEARVDGEARRTTFVSEDKLRFELLPEDVQEKRTLQVRVANPGKPGPSNADTLEVE
jgi:hypothetical protein